MHTAKRVNYAIKDFGDKNLDAIQREMTECIMKSKNNDLIKIFNVFEDIKIQ